MGIDDKIGSLKPGKRADLIAISPNALNMAVVTDPAHLVLEATGPENVDTVVVDGRILKRGGKLVAHRYAQGDCRGARRARRRARAHEVAVSVPAITNTAATVVLLRVGALGRIIRENPHMRLAEESRVRAALAEREDQAAVALNAATWVVTARR